MVRGIERTLIFRNTTDRGDFVARVAALAERDRSNARRGIRSMTCANTVGPIGMGPSSLLPCGRCERWIPAYARK